METAVIIGYILRYRGYVMTIGYILGLYSYIGIMENEMETAIWATIQTHYGPLLVIDHITGPDI